MTLKLRLLFLTVITLVISSCDKSENTGPDDNAKMLTKINSWDPASGMESNLVQISYNSSKEISTVFISPYTYSLEYNSAGKLSKAVGISPTGNQITLQADFNSAGQMIKSTVTSKPAGQTVGSITRFDAFEYNGDGKIIRVSSFAPDGLTITSVTEYSWTANNIQECTVGKGATAQIRKANSFTTSALGYDDKINPMTKLGQLGEMVYSRAFSRNNPTQMKVKDAVAVDFVTEAFPIYEYKAGAVAGVKYNLHEGNSLIHLNMSGNKGLKFGYE